MHLLTFNINMALRKQLDVVDAFGADILIIQECENPAESNDKNYRKWAGKHFWVGHNKHKGLGVFIKNGVEAELLNWDAGDLRYFIPIRVNDSFNLLAVWNCDSEHPNKRYIAQLGHYIQKHGDKFGEIIIAGDFNANVIWDHLKRDYTMSEVIQELKTLQISSIYHDLNSEEHGKETQPTLIFRKDLSKTYHIDYVFASKSLATRVKSIKIGESSKYLNVSDHMPVLVELAV